MSEFKKEWVVFDLDGTLFNMSHRLELAKEKRWDDFHSACGGDTPYEDVITLFHMANSNYFTIILTGRNERFRSITMEQLKKHSINPDHLLMRGDKDFTPDGEFKLKALEAFFGPKEELLGNVIFCIDDRDSVIEPMRNYGLTVFQSRLGDH